MESAALPGRAPNANMGAGLGFCAGPTIIKKFK